MLGFLVATRPTVALGAVHLIAASRRCLPALEIFLGPAEVPSGCRVKVLLGISPWAAPLAEAGWSSVCLAWIGSPGVLVIAPPFRAATACGDAPNTYCYIQCFAFDARPMAPTSETNVLSHVLPM